MNASVILGPNWLQHQQAAVQRDGPKKEATDKHVEKEDGGVDATEGGAQRPSVAARHVVSEEGQGQGGQEVRGSEIQDPDSDDGAADVKAHDSNDEEVLYDANGREQAMEANGENTQGAHLGCLV